MLRFSPWSSAILLTPLRGVRPLREFWITDKMCQVLSDPAALPRPGSPERPRTSVSTEAAEHWPQGIVYCHKGIGREISSQPGLFQLFQLVA